MWVTAGVRTWYQQMTSLTHCGRDKMDAISQTTFSNAFSWMKMFEYRLKFHWSLFLRVQLTMSQHWFRLWLRADQATSHYLDQCWLHYRCIYASLGLNELMQNWHPVEWSWLRPQCSLLNAVSYHLYHIIIRIISHSIQWYRIKGHFTTTSW